MRRWRLQWKLYPSFLLVILLSLIAIGGYASHSIRQFHLTRIRADIETRARLLRRDLPASFPHTSADSLNALAGLFSSEARARITLVSASGRVLADSDLPPTVELLAQVGEVREALSGRTGFAVRYSTTARSEAIFVALPVYRDAAVAGALRVAVPLASLAPALQLLNFRIGLSAAIVAVLAGLITLAISTWITRAVTDMKQGAERLAAGDLSARMAVPTTREFAELATALNEMAQQLDEKIRTITAQRNEQQAILTSLREGVIALDSRERVMFVNRAAAELLGLDQSRVTGRILLEVVRASELQQFIERMAESGAQTVESEVTMLRDEPSIFHVTGTGLHDAAGRLIGTLVVLSDITRLRRLESVRRDFVANVSHELKTPVTSIKGYVETLVEGGLSDPEAAQSFLNRIAQNTDRLNAIIEDLLDLARIEQDSERAAIEFELGSVRDAVQAAVSSSSAPAAARHIGIGLVCREDVRVRMNSTLLEQALLNLLDNAIKYSDPGRIVDVEIARDGTDAVIRVRDHGCGIPAEHLPRIFERFYRVDKARSRKLGGTGLGLAIVKHIVQAHGGRVTVESEVGVGSTFSIILPVV